MQMHNPGLRFALSVSAFVAAFSLCSDRSAAQQHQYEPASLTTKDFFSDPPGSLDTKRSLEKESSALFPPAEEKKNVALAALYSLLLPGMGELSVGNYSTGKYFTMAEASLWMTWSSFQLYGGWLQTDARNFAVQHAGVNLSGKQDQYLIDIGNFQNVNAFDDEMLRERNPFKIYPTNSTYSWNWDSDANRERYREIRVSSDQVYNSSRYLVAAIVINHVASAINAGRMAASYNSDAGLSDGLSVRAEVLGGSAGPNGLLVTFSRDF